MTNIFEAYARATLQQYSEPLVELIRQGNDTGARDLLLKIQAEHPAFAAFIKNLFSGSPAQVVEGVADFWPDVRRLPNVEHFASLLQKRLREEWEKPRGILPPRRRA